MGRSPYSAGGEYHVFLSFSGVQSRRAAQVLANWIDELLPPVRVFFYGPESAAIGSDWMDHVYDGLRDADALVSFVTRDNFDKYWIKEELEAARHSTRCQMILLILLDGLPAGDLPPDLRSRQAKPWSTALLRNLLILFGREARVKDIEAIVKARGPDVLDQV